MNIVEKNIGKKVKTKYHFQNHEIALLYSTYTENVRDKLLDIRHLIFEIADKHEEIGNVVETIKWNVPSYLTRHPKSGLTIRLDPLLNSDHNLGIYVHCQSSFVEQCRTILGDKFNYDGNRGILMKIDKKYPKKELQYLIYRALTYHLRKKHSV